MLKKNQLKQKLSSGKPVLGTWAVIPSPVTIDVIASSGVDFIILDSEHGPLDFERAQEMLMACDARGVSGIMRVGDVNVDLIQKALDIGAHGIQVPNVSTLSQAQSIVKFAKYPPHGDRGYSPFTRAGEYSIKNAAKLTNQANENTLLIVNVEGKEGIENIDSILQIKEIDTIFLGAFDISKALGMPGEVNRPEVQTTLEKLTKKVINSGKSVGTISTSQVSLSQYYDMGMTYLVHLVDCQMLKASYEKVVEDFRQLESVSPSVISINSKQTKVA